MKNKAYSVYFRQLKAHRAEFDGCRLEEIVAQDERRFDECSLTVAGLFLDYSKNFFTRRTRQLWSDMLDALQLPRAVEQYFSGDKINDTENRAVLHTALRNLSDLPIYVDDHNVMPDIHAMRQQMEKIVQAVQTGTWQGYSEKSITDVVNIGIGGSDLGPEMVYQALLPHRHNHVNVHFISNLDASNFQEIVKPLSADRTLFVVVSKSFTTQETLTNAKLAKSWVLASGCRDTELHKHFIAVSAAVEKAVEFGIQPENILPMWDWVGGRFSLWSAVGLSIALSIGMKNFTDLLAGAYAMDQHFRQASFEENMPVILAVLSAWYINFFDAQTFCILPYSYYLRLLPDYLQQASMESLGKSVDHQGNTVNYQTGGILWGGAGTNTQHSFHQLLFQGTHFVPVHFILPLSSGENELNEQLPIMAHCLGQSQILMRGYSRKENVKELMDRGLDCRQADHLAQYKTIRGNMPSNVLLCDELSPYTLGALIALYEHKIFVESIIWNVNAYDQWGVERGKKLAVQLLGDLKANSPSGDYDASTLGLFHHIQNKLSKK
jgi:glucose-6-phosphate isomerase